MDSKTFLQKADRLQIKPFYVLFGDEDFLKRQVLDVLRALVLDKEESAFGLSTHAGDQAEFAGVRDELDTLPFLSSRRLVVIENADPFVTRFRPLLEKYAGQPSGSGVLVLLVKSWPSNTRIAKLVPADATIDCKAPPMYKLSEWCMHWAANQYGKQIDSAAASLLVNLIGAEMGQLDQELNKLAIYVGQAKQIKADDVDKLVGNSRNENTWKIFDSIGAGRAAEALTILGRLFEQGEEPLRVLGAFSMQLRRLAQAARLNQQGEPMPRALERAGIPPFARRDCEQHLRHLGQRRTNQLYDWLLEADLGLKGSSQLPPRTLLEKLVVQLSRK
jgi:DNA polymerase-3 subunit delta